MKSAAPERLALGGLIALAAAMGVGRFIYTPILPHMVAALDLSQGGAGSIASANFAGYLVGALLASSPWGRGSARRWMLGALAASALSTAAMAATSTVAAFLALRFIGGVASAFVLVFASTLILDRLAIAGRGGLSALHFAGVGIGIAVSAVAVAAIDAAGGDWRIMWLVGGVLSVGSVAIVAGLVADAAADTPGARGGGSAPLGRLILAYGLFGFGYVITATFIIQIARGTPGLRAYETGIWVLVGLSAVPSVALWMVVGRRIGVLRAFAAASAIAAIGVIASVVWGGLAGLLVAAACLGATFMGMTALGLVAARARAGGEERRTAGLMTAAFGLGQIIGPVVAGWGVDVTGSFLWPSLMAAACLLAGAALTARLDR